MAGDRGPAFSTSSPVLLLSLSLSSMCKWSINFTAAIHLRVVPTQRSVTPITPGSDSTSWVGGFVHDPEGPTTFAKRCFRLHIYVETWALGVKVLGYRYWACELWLWEFKLMLARQQHQENIV